MKVRSSHAWVSSILVSAVAAACVSSAPAPTEESSEEGPVGEAQQALVTDCDYLDPALHTPLPVPVDYEKELVITDLSVTEDPCRTTWAPTVLCPSHTVGAWTFANLMEKMAGTTPVHEFVAEWLDTFETMQTVNGFPVPPRSNFRSAVLDPWLVASGCSAGDPIVGPGACALDLKIAPLRLLGIVNRVDLEGLTYGNDSPGEARLVFGWLTLPVKGRWDKNGQLRGDPLKGTVIFEYKLPPTRTSCEWSEVWHDLSGMSFGAGFNNHLQKLTDLIVSPIPGLKAPNKGSSIGQVRTNDILGNEWALREYTLQDVGRGIDGFALANGPTAQTPDDSMNNHPDLNAWTVANAADIDATLHSLPVIDPVSGTPFIGGESTASFFIWEDGNTPPLSFDERFHFGFSTCNDCHTAATNTGFTHISPRPLGTQAPLSDFLSQTTVASTFDPGLPAGTQFVTDPFSGNTYEFNEPWRRVCEVNRILRCVKKPFTRSNGGVH